VGAKYQYGLFGEEKNLFILPGLSYYIRHIIHILVSIFILSIRFYTIAGIQGTLGAAV